MSETALEKWDRGKTLLLESLFKPDSRLRGCAYNQNCYDEDSYSHHKDYQGYYFALYYVLHT